MILCEEYLASRGITDESIKTYGLECVDVCAFPADTIKQRLGRKLPEGVNELIWFPLLNGKREITSWIARLLPNIEGEPKFLCSFGNGGPPFIPPEVYKLKHGKPLILTESPIKVLPCLQAGVYAIGLNGVWCASVENADKLHVIRADLLEALDWRGRKVYLAFDADWTINPKVRHALFRLFFIMSVSGAEVFQLTWDLNEGKGIDDYLVNQQRSNGQHDAKDVLFNLLSEATPFINSLQATAVDVGLISQELRNVWIPDVLRSQLCRQLAKPLGVRVSALEDLTVAEVPPEKRGRIEETIEPWGDPVDGVVLLQEIYGQVSRFVIIDDNGYVVTCLHSVLAYSWEVFFKLPILRLKSPVKRCGKSTMLDVIERLVLRPLLTVSVSPAGLFRIIENFHPYIMVDEADTFGAENDELRTIVNGGFERGRPAIRVNKETLKPEFFDTFCPKVLASIGGLHETIEDRSIIVNMKRKPPGAEVEELCDCDLSVFTTLRRKLQRWAIDNRDTIKATKLPRPKALLDRAWNKWRPLLTIAHVVGGKWPDMCLKAALDMAGDADEERSHAIEALIRIRDVFKEKRNELLFSKRDNKKLLPTFKILDHLNSDKEAPWADWGKGDDKGLTTHKLASMLKPFKIKSAQRQINGMHCHGYFLEDFKEAFESYLSPEEPDKPDEAHDDDDKNES
jgi:putative DNA primase/helicase